MASVRGRSTQNIRAYAFLAPTLLILIFVFGYQIVRLFFFSLVQWQGYRYTNQFNYFSHFTFLFAGGFVGAPLLRSVLVIVVVIPVVIFLGSIHRTPPLPKDPGVPFLPLAFLPDLYYPGCRGEHRLDLPLEPLRPRK